MTPQQVVDEVKLSGLRGRGGGNVKQAAAFPVFQTVTDLAGLHSQPSGDVNLVHRADRQPERQKQNLELFAGAEFQFFLGDPDRDGKNSAPADAELYFVSHTAPFRTVLSAGDLKGNSDYYSISFAKKK